MEESFTVNQRENYVDFVLESLVDIVRSGQPNDQLAAAEILLNFYLSRHF